MCKNAASTVANLLQAAQPELVDLLTVTGLAATPDGQAAIAAYSAMLVAVRGWTSGTAIQAVVQVINAFTAVFDVLPFPPEVEALVNVISAVVVTVLGVLTANSPAPAAPPNDPTAGTAEEIQAAYQHEVALDTEARVTKLVPGFKRSIFTSPQHQFRGTWNRTLAPIAAANAKYAVLEMA